MAKKKVKKSTPAVNKLKAEAKSLGQKVLKAIDKEIVDANKFVARLIKDLKSSVKHEKASMKKIKAAEIKANKLNNQGARKEVEKARKAATEAFAAARHAAEKLAGANQALAKIKMTEFAEAVVERAENATRAACGGDCTPRSSPADDV